jgi:glutamate/aspartate transport system substrate-binding protein
MKMRGAVFLFCLAWFAPVRDASATALERIAANKRITVAYSKTASPFSLIDATGAPIGYAIDVCDRVVLAVKRELGLRNLAVEWTSQPFTERLKDVREGRADLECANTISTADRRANLDFSLPIYIAATKVVVHSTTATESIAELKRRRFGAITGSAQERLVAAIDYHYTLNAQAISFKTGVEVVNALAARSIDALVMSDVTFHDLIATTRSREVFRTLPKIISIDSICITLPKGDVKFKAVVDRTISEMMSTGEIKRLYTKWFERPIPPRGFNLGLRANHLTVDHFKRPTQASDSGDGVLLLTPKK